MPHKSSCNARFVARQDLVLWFIAGVSLFLFGRNSYLNSQHLGLFQDEVYFVAPAMRMALGLEYPRHQPFTGLEQGYWPPAIGSYVYSMPLSYIFALIFKLFEPHAGIIRAVFSTMHLLLVVTATGMVGVFFTRRAALITFSVLLSQPSFYFVTRDSPDTLFQALLMMVCLTLLAYAFRARTSWPVFLAGLLLGFSVNTKISFVPTALAILAGAILCLRRTPRIARYRLLDPVLLGIGLAIGMFELLLLNFYQPLLLEGASFLSTQLDASRVKQAPFVLAAGYQFISGAYFPMSGISLWNYFSAPLIFGITLLPLVAWGKRVETSSTRQATCILLGVSILIPGALYLFIPSKIEARHIGCYLYPPLVILFAIMFAERLNGLPTRCKKSALLATLLLTCAYDWVINFRYTSEVIARGGAGWHANAIYPTAEQVSRFVPERIIFLDWGIKDAVDVLNQGRFEIVDNFQAKPRLAEIIHNATPRTLFVATPSLATPFSLYEEFQEQLRVQRKTAETLHTIHHHGHEFAVLLRLKPG